MYSLVVKEHFFLTLGLVPGGSLSTGDYNISPRESINTHVSVNLKVVSAIGYNGDRFILGAQVIGDGYNVRLDDDAKTAIGRGKLMFYLGYRFQGKRAKKVREKIN